MSPSSLRFVLFEYFMISSAVGTIKNFRSNFFDRRSLRFSICVDSNFDN